VVVAAALVVRAPIKNVLQKKVMGTTDYLFWKKYGDPTQQHKGDDTSFVKTKVAQDLHTTLGEREGYVKNKADSLTTEDSVSSSVEDGSQVVLKAVNLNDILP